MAAIDSLRSSLIGKSLHHADVCLPAAVLDLAKLEVNCSRMLDTTRKFGLGWRAHIKTHKTIQLTRLQLGNSPDSPANIIVSTLLEAENILPLLREYNQQGRPANVLWGFPISPSSVTRLASILAALGPNSLSLLVDHPSQLSLASEISSIAGHPPLLFIKIDPGYHRAGVEPGTPALDDLVRRLIALHATGDVVFHGLYTHAGQSYAVRQREDAQACLADEFAVLERASARVRDVSPGTHIPLVLSLGATPTATSLEDDAVMHEYAHIGEPGSHAAALASLVHRLRRANLRLELHAGVYPTLDLQQLATHARAPSHLSASAIAITILAEVASVYPGRGPHGTTEALVTAGSLALGREPCSKDVTSPEGYTGWGVVSAWGGVENEPPGDEFPQKYTGWTVGRISQEHAILVWNGKGGPGRAAELSVGQRVRIWPNHSCVAGAAFDYYLVVDSRREPEHEIVDVWPRWRGW